jgi:DnaJ-class molecular chaperone
MPDDDRPTPIPDERPTEPEIGHVTCGECAGQRRVLRTIETAAGYKARGMACPECKGTGVQSKQEYEAWILRRTVA